MTNPVIAEVTRGGVVESRHRGAVAVVNGAGATVLALGDVSAAIFPRSAIKAFQCLPVIESGAADHFGFTEEEIALCCSSHNGEAEHVRVARAILAKCGASEAHYECGAHWPLLEAAHHAAVRALPEPKQVHNNCSGKHAGMLALARQLGADPLGYVQHDHAVQRAIAAAMGKICDVDLDHAPWGVDGCSVPTWAVPLDHMALGFARLAAPDHAAGRRIIAAVRAHPFMVAGSERFDTEIMQAIPRLFCKVGAEGVYGAAIPHAGLGIALKVDDGQGRGAEVALAETLLRLDVWTDDERQSLMRFRHHPLSNWRKIAVGEVRGVNPA